MGNGLCKYHNKHLVVMETEQEWEFIKNAIQNRVGSKYGEWFIGLEMNITSGNWTWINGAPLTIDKWEKSSPVPNDFNGMIHKEFPPGIKGFFSTIIGIAQRGWINEKESGIDQDQITEMIIMHESELTIGCFFPPFPTPYQFFFPSYPFRLFRPPHTKVHHL